MINRREWIRSAGMAGMATWLGGITETKASQLKNTDVWEPGILETGGISRLSSNENPYGPSKKVREEIKRSLDLACRYPFEYADALVNDLAAREGVDKDCIVLTGGSSEGLRITGLTYGLYGREIISADPTFHMLMEYAEHFGSHIHRVPVDEKMQHNLKEMEKRITANTGLVFVCNPNNPTGTLLPSGEVRDFCDSISGRTLVFSDEAYYDYIEESGYPSMTSLVREGKNVVVSRTFSKVYGMAGLRVGYLIARPDIAARLRDKVAAGTSVLSIQAARVALQDTGFYQFSLERNKEARDFLYSIFNQLKLPYIPSHANFVFFHLGSDVRTFIAKMKEHGVLVGRPFPPFMDWCRISTGTMEEMEHFADALKKML